MYILRVYDYYDNEIHKDITRGKTFNSQIEAKRFLNSNIPSYREYSIINIG